jgi:hypothetical protein
MSKVVSIGRNIQGFPMSDIKWEQFIGHLMNLIDVPTNNIHFTGRGNGFYETKREESFTVIFTGTVPEEALAALAGKYMQDSIALTEGETKFIDGRETA